MNHAKEEPEFQMSTIYSAHIEKAEKEFQVKVLRAPNFNVLYRPQRWEIWTVLAETPEGALNIARYHFYRSNQIELIEAAKEVA